MNNSGQVVQGRRYMVMRHGCIFTRAFDSPADCIGYAVMKRHPEMRYKTHSNKLWAEHWVAMKQEGFAITTLFWHFPEREAFEIAAEGAPFEVDQRELMTRAIDCPCCVAKAGQRCWADGPNGAYHTELIHIGRSVPKQAEG